MNNAEKNTYSITEKSGINHSTKAKKHSNFSDKEMLIFKLERVLSSVFASHKNHTHQSAKSRQRSWLFAAIALSVLFVFAMMPMHFSLAYELDIDGYKCYVSDPAEYHSVADEVSKTVSDIINSDYALSVIPKFSRVVVNRNDLEAFEDNSSELYAVLIEHADSLIVHGYALNIDGVPVAVSEDKTTLNFALNCYENSFADNLTQDVSITNDISIEYGLYPRSLVVNDTEELVALMNSDICQSGSYTVKSGDTAETIASAFGLTEEALTANIGLTTSMLTAGMTINMESVMPLLDVQVVKTEVYTETIPYETVITETADRYTTYRKTKVKGQNGTAEITANVTYVNGEEVSREIVSTAVISEPITERITIGTTKPPRWLPTGTFIMPVTGRVTSPYGYRGTEFHTGIDWGANKGTPIYASDGGTVIFAGTKGNYGKLVIIEHEDDVTTYYAHCSKLYVSKGDKVAQGDKIAAVGSTGRSTGPHLHFEIRINGKTVSPLDQINKKK